MDTMDREDPIVDQSTLTLLEHVNLNVPSQTFILPFYYDLLGCGMDPRKAANVVVVGANANDDDDDEDDDPSSSTKNKHKKQTLWANCGASQFHLPHGTTAQRIPGMIGVRYNSLDGVKERLQQQQSSTDPNVKACVKSFTMGTSPTAGDYVKLTDAYDNVFFCRSGGNPLSHHPHWQQPIMTPPNEDDDDTTEEQPWKKDVANRYGRTVTDCCGIDFVEYPCPVGTAERIALFYDSVLDATTSILTANDCNNDNDDDDDSKKKIAIVAFGNVRASGKADQSLIFRETSEPIPKYDGHHIAMYIGQSQADFERAFQNAEMANIVWVNPRFSDKAMTLEGAKKWKQFRFKDIVDMKTGKPIFQLEHEMRSIEHEAWPGKRDERL